MKEYFEVFFPEGHDKTVLLADDDPTVRELTQKLLNRLGFDNVLLAANGKEALEAYFKRKREIVAVVSDLRMPEMDGEELFWRLKEADKQVRMILCSGYVNGTDVNAMLKAGLKGFLQKPFTSEEFTLALANTFF